MTAAGELRVDLVFEGGGVKGIGLAGAFLELEERGYRPQCVAGTSAGAITAALVAAGYAGAELEQVVTTEMDFNKFADRPRLQALGAAGELIDVAQRLGIHSGDYFLTWIGEKLRAKGIATFGDLRDDTTDDEARRYRLQVIASDLTDQSMLVLPRDAPRLGLDPDRLGVAEAVRMSMSIPVFFEPARHTDPASGETHVIVDGGLLSNFPVWLFDCPPGTPPAFPTFGVALVAPGQRDPVISGPAPSPNPRPVAPTSPVEFAKALASTAMEAHDRFYIEDENFARTVAVPTLGVRTTDFDIPPDRVLALIGSGRQAAARFLRSWDFAAYIARYRSPGASTARSAGGDDLADGQQRPGVLGGAASPSPT